MIDIDDTNASRLALTTGLRARYLKALLAGDRSSAEAVIQDGMALDVGTPDLLLEVLVKAQGEMGERWHRGDLTASEEHWGTEVTFGQVERVLRNRRPRQKLGRRVVVATVSGERHTLAARILAALLSWKGFTVDYLGAAPPVEDFVQYVRQRAPDLIALSITMEEHREAIVETCRMLQRLETTPPILLGGQGVGGLDSSDLGVAAIVPDALEGIETATRLVGLGAKRDLDAYLMLVGRRINERRLSARMNQAELAKRSGLTRPYLSAVERGKQNITLEAALKIAGALEMDMAEMLDEVGR